MSQMAHRKQLETTDLEFFLAAYRESTGRYVVEANPSERPDFICRINNNREVGIELTKIVREPETAFWQRILYGRDYLDASDLPEKIIGVIEKKSPKCSDGLPIFCSTFIDFGKVDRRHMQILWLFRDLACRLF